MDRHFKRVCIITDFLTAFQSGEVTLKQLTTIVSQPSPYIKAFIDNGYVVKTAWGKYKWNYPINSTNITSTADIISRNWNKRNVYKKVSISDASTEDLLSELNRRKVHLKWSYTKQKYILS